MQTQLLKWISIFLLAAVVSSCNKKYGVLQVRFHHFSPNTAELKWVYAGKDTVAKTAYLQSSEYEQASLENISFTAFLKEQVVISVSSPNWEENKRYSVFVCDTLGTIKKVLLSDAHDTAPAGKALVRFVNLLPDTFGAVVAANGNELFGSKKFYYAVKNYADGFSGFEPLDAGVYDFSIRTEIDSLPVEFQVLQAASIENGKVYNLVATGYANASSGLEMKLVAVPFTD